jgi:hypothetical protein
VSRLAGALLLLAVLRPSSDVDDDSVMLAVAVLCSDGAPLLAVAGSSELRARQLGAHSRRSADRRGANRAVLAVSGMLT